MRQWIDFKLTNVLPLPGGTLNQDPEFMRDLRMILSLENSWKAAEIRKKEAEAAIKEKLGRK